MSNIIQTLHTRLTDNPSALIEATAGQGVFHQISNMVDRDAIVIDINLLQAVDGNDILGVQRITNDCGELKVIRDHPYFAESALRDDVETYLIFSPLSGAIPRVANCVYELLHNRTLNGQRLPDNTYLIGVVAPSDDNVV